MHVMQSSINGIETSLYVRLFACPFKMRYIIEKNKKVSIFMSLLPMRKMLFCLSLYNCVIHAVSIFPLKKNKPSLTDA